MSKVLVHLIAAARPNFMKIAPLYHALKTQQWCDPKIVHTGQHYDPNMSDAFFQDLKMPRPDFHLEVGSGTHAEQTGGVMIAYEKVCLQSRPDWIIVVGDVNSTAACALVGAKLWIPVIHLEAGLRSHDRRMPEEINRLVTDAIANVLWVPSADAIDNLRAEGIATENIDFVGNIMIDSYELLRVQIENSDTRKKLGLDNKNYGIVTLHRPSNVDRKDTLNELITQLNHTAEQLNLVFAVHPRTRNKLEEFSLWSKLAANPNILLTEPLGYIEFMNLVSAARVAITDSGGIQEETTYLGITCLTLRENTERPITIKEGTNRLISAVDLAEQVRLALSRSHQRRSRPEKWDGNTSDRCVEALMRRAGI